MDYLYNIYKKTVLRSEYKGRYAVKQRGKIKGDDWFNIQTGGSIDFCEDMLEKMRSNGYEAHLIFTKENKNFIHAAVIYKNPNKNKWYIADPITDIKKFTGMVPKNEYKISYSSEKFNEKMRLIEKSKNKEIDVNEYIKQYGNIFLYNINVEEQVESISDYNQLEQALKEETEYDEFGFNKYKIHENGTLYDKNGFDYRGINRRGFNKEGIHYLTNKPYDERGLNSSGHFDYYDDGYSIIGFNMYQRHRNGSFYDDDGYDIRGLDRKKFNREGINYRTGEPYDENGYNQNGEYYYDDEGYDYQGYNKEGYDKKGYDKKGFDSKGIHKNGTKYDDEGYNIEEYDKEGYNKKGYNKKGINKKTGEKDSRIILVEEFVNSNSSKKKFCLDRNIDLGYFNRLINEILSEYPDIDIKEDIDKVSKKSSAIYLSKRERMVNKLIKGEISFEEYCNNNSGIKVQDLLLEVEGTENKKTIYEIIGNGLTSKKHDMMDYIRIFSNEQIDNTIYQKTMQEFIKFEKEVLKYKELIGIYKKLKAEERRLQVYQKPFNKNTCSQRIGHFNKKTGKIEFTEITYEHIRYAKQHLFNTGKFICSCNMEEVFSQFANGQLSFENIEKEKITNTDLKQLSSEEEELAKEAENIKTTEDLISKREGNTLGNNGGENGK